MMASIITVLSSDDENDDEIQIIGEKRSEVKVVALESTNNNLTKQIKIENSNDYLQPLNESDVKRIAPTLLSTSVSIRRAPCKSPPLSSIKRELLNGYHDSKSTRGTSIPTSSRNPPILITLEDDEEDGNDAQVNGSLAEDAQHSNSSRKKPEVITLDDEGEEEQDSHQSEPEVKSEGSCRSSVILIDSEGMSEPDDWAEAGDNADGPDGGKVKLEDIDEICRISDESDEEANHCSSDSTEEEGAGSVSSKGMDGDQEEGSNLGETTEVMDEPKHSPSCASGPSLSIAGPSSSNAEQTPSSAGPSSSSAGLTSSPARPASSSAGTSSSGAEPSEHTTSKPAIEIDVSGPGNLTEKLLKQLITTIGKVGFSQENLTCVTKKIMKYYNNAMENFTQSEEFIDRVKNLIIAIGELMDLPSPLERLDAISTKIHEFLTVFKRGSTHLTSHLKKLYKTWEKLAKRIAILENTEVESDDEYENPYIMLDRYRKRAVQVYDKICQLENKSNHADRQYKREFVYAQGVGPVPIQRAVEKYYNKTKKFPDFSDIYKLVKRVNEEKNLGLRPAQAHSIAEQVFVDFGKKLKRRREYDEFLISRCYLPEEATDPAEYDPSLKEKLDVNFVNAKKEEDVLREFVLKEAEAKESGDKTGQGDDDDDDDVDNSGDETEREDEAKVTFVDSDEEIANLEKPPDHEKEPASERAKIDENEKEQSSKRAKPDDSEDESTSKRPKIDDNASIDTPTTDRDADAVSGSVTNGRDAESVSENIPTKDSYMTMCGLQPN